jgi:hypothetical protein
MMVAHHMPIPMQQLIDEIDPRRTVLLFGAGSSIPSGGPKVDDLIEHFATTFTLPGKGYKLSEISTFAQTKTSRRRVITELRGRFKAINLSGGLKDIPLYPWRGIYTTNYDLLIEDAYKLHNKICRVFSCNFDFGLEETEDPDCCLYKLHGTIDKDICDGNQSRIILTEEDYEHTEQYRQYLYDRLKGDLAGADLIIIGQSLADPDMSETVTRAAALNTQILAPARLTILLYEPDELRASLYERKGLKVVFGGIDDFFTSLVSKKIRSIAQVCATDDPVLAGVRLGASMLEISKVSDVSNANIGAMFNGWPATFADIQAGLTFERDVAKQIADYFEGDAVLCVTLLGAAGVGKSTAARQATLIMQRAGFRCWEHRVDQILNIHDWRKVAANLKSNKLVGCLLVDDAHVHLHNLNQLIDQLVSDDNAHLKVVIVSNKNHWYPRSKTPSMYRYGNEFKLSQLNATEIERLLNLIERQPKVRELVEDNFSGFNRVERHRRLVHRCQADMFVCLKNIFASENFDDIILREFADLDDDHKNIYRHIAAMETAGVQIHRQLIMRILKIPGNKIAYVLEGLDGIVEEYEVSEKYGIFGWRCRHPVISAIVTKYEFREPASTLALFDSVIDSISPTYDIEIRTIRELCNLETGISRIPDVNEQNRLLRKMISNVPGERVPRHRLIRNLIQQGAFEKAETEIRVFNNDFGNDGPVHRYKILLMIARANNTPGILEEHRQAILEDARELAISGIAQFQNSKSILATYAELGVEYFRRTGRYTIFDEAIEQLRLAEERLGDPDVTAIIARFQRRIAAQNTEKGDEL